MKQFEHMEKDKVGKLLLKFSIPSIIGMLANASYNIVDRMFVGRGVGTLAISGITITFPLVILIMGLALLIGIGSTALVSIRLGQKNKEEAENILGNAFTLAMIISIFVTILSYIFIDPLLIMFGGSGQVLVYAKQFMHVALIGVTFQTVSFSLNAIIRGEGNPRMAMSTMIIGAVINIVLDYILIFIFKVGIQGAAYATMTGQLFSFIYVISYFRGKKSVLKLRAKNFKLDPKIVKGIFAIGISPFAMQVANSVIFVMLNTSLLKYGGNTAIAAMGTINAVMMMILMPIFGMNQGMGPIVGYNYGAQNYHRVKNTMRIAMLSASALCLLGFTLIMVYSRNIMGMFSANDPQLMEVGSYGIRMMCMTLPLVGFQVIESAYFQAINKAKISLILTLTRQVFIIIPAILIMPGVLGLGLAGIWLAGPLADAFTAILAVAFILPEIKRLNRLHHETPREPAFVTN